MIVDTLDQLYKYQAINPNINFVIEYIKSHELINSTLGSHILNDSVKMIRETYLTKPLENCIFESHEVFGDIQIVLRGEEYFGYMKPTDSLFKITESYNKDKDVVKGIPIGEFSKILLKPGMFALVLKDELHMPKLESVSNTQVDKVVFKIKL